MYFEFEHKPIATMTIVARKMENLHSAKVAERHFKSFILVCLPLDTGEKINRNKLQSMGNNENNNNNQWEIV